MAANPQTFFVTGCASGIGRHVADRLAREGRRLMAADVNFEVLQAHAAAAGWPEDRVFLARLDVRDPDAWERVFADAVARLGHVDVCLNIAGVLKSSWMYETSLEDIHTQLDVNTKGVIFGTQVAARHMIARAEGHIVNLSSMAGIAPIPGLAVYTASKFAVRGFSLAAAIELRTQNVAVTTLCPDGVNTPLLDLPPENEAAAMIFSGRRLFEVEEIGAVIFDKIIPHRPLEVILPRSRSVLAKLSSLFPRLTAPIVPRLQKKGHRAHLGRGKRPPR
jgi:3-oxoacyl-[acyl-carrier protein] reductase